MPEPTDTQVCGFYTEEVGSYGHLLPQSIGVNRKIEPTDFK